MDWRTPEKVFGNSLDPVVLRVLWAAGREMTGEQVARVAKAGSPRGIRYALGRLADDGIVDARSVGASVVYEVNTEHLTYPAVDAAFRALDPWGALRERLAALTGSHDEPGSVSVAIFGSVARGEAGPDSDVDVLLVVPQADDRAADFRTLLARQMRRWTGREAGIYLTTPARLVEAERAGDPIIESFARDAITLVGPDVHTYWKAIR
jgi:predicted nucleotidyltransferase